MAQNTSLRTALKETSYNLGALADIALFLGAILIVPGLFISLIAVKVFGMTATNGMITLGAFASVLILAVLLLVASSLANLASRCFPRH